jgi:hypothetical protein
MARNLRMNLTVTYQIYWELSEYSLLYHPQANGLDERFNQTLQNMILKFIKDNKKEDWDTQIDRCIYAYNTRLLLRN